MNYELELEKLKNNNNILSIKVNALMNESKSYVALVSQTSTDAPTVESLLKDDIDGPVWSYSAVGTYLLTKADAFTADKTIPNDIAIMYDSTGNKITLEYTSSDVMTLKTYAVADTSVLADAVITKQLVEIKIYS